MELNRDVDSDLIDSLSGHFNPVVFVYIDWPTGPVRVNSSTKVINAFGEDWLPSGAYGSISIPEESMSIGAPTTTIKLAGDLDTLIDELDQDPRNRDVVIYFSTLVSLESDQINGTPVNMFTGYVDGVDFEFSRDSVEFGESSISITVASGPSPRSNTSLVHSNESQLIKFPNDTAGEMVVNYNKRAVNPDAWPEP